jgi:transcriptional regulator EpsA
MKAANYAPASHHSALRPPSLGDNGLGLGASQELRPPSLGDNSLGLGASQEASLFRVLCESRLIARRMELIGWLQGEVRRVLPHQILIAAWGDFARLNVKCDLVSSIPGVRSLPLGRCPAEEFIRNSYRRWVRGGREPLRLDAAEASPTQVPCHCPLHIAIGQMRSLVVHGVSDKLSGCDSLYLFLDSRSRAELDAERGFVALAHLLVCQIDVAWRRVAAVQLSDLPGAQLMARTRPFSVSDREREILHRLAYGSSNSEIAQALEISVFTVKNHLKRIFRKIGVTNRTQAAARYNDALIASERDVPAALATTAER